MKDWEKDLSHFFEKRESKKQHNEEKVKQKKSEVESFYSLKVVPAFEELKNELEKHGREVSVYASKEHASIAVKFEGVEEYHYAIKVRIFPNRAFPYPETHFTSKKDGKSYKSEGFIRSGSQDYDIADISKEEIIHNFLEGYKLHVEYYD